MLTVSTTAKRLQEIMYKKGLRQIDVVNKCQRIGSKYNVNIRRADISQYLSGKVTPNQRSLSVLATALGTNEVYLMGFDVPDTPDMNNTSVKYSLTGVERELIDNFRLLDEDGQEEIIEFIGVKIKHLKKSGTDARAI